jgi:hypothetical protein
MITTRTKTETRNPKFKVKTEQERKVVARRGRLRPPKKVLHRRSPRQARVGKIRSNVASAMVALSLLIVGRMAIPPVAMGAVMSDRRWC